MSSEGVYARTGMSRLSVPQETTRDRDRDVSGEEGVWDGTLETDGTGRTWNGNRVVKSLTTRDGTEGET